MPRPAIAGYTEKFETWQASSNTTWQTKDLSVGPFNVPANAVVEIAVTNLKANQAREAGVRAFGSSLERKLDIHEAEGGGTDVLVMHVQTDASSRIEHYAEGATDVDFFLLGYWDSGTYVEKISAFTAGADAMWTDVNLSTYGVSASEIAEIALLNNQDSGAREAGVRTNGSSLARLVDIHEAEGTGGGVDALSMVVAADGTSNATIEAYAETDADVDFYLLGYWTTAPDTYTEMFVDMGSPSADATWEDKDLSGGSFNLPADVVAEIATGNQFETEENNMGVRANGSSLARLFDLQEAEGAAGADGADLARAHVLVDQAARIEFYHQDVSDTHQFTLLGYWGPTSGVRLSNHAAGQETDAFSEAGIETDAELFGFRIQDLDGDTSSITQLVFRISNITGLVNGDWAGVELVEDTNGDGTISGGETTTVGGAGTVSTSGGTITFSTSFNVSSAINYILRADFASLGDADEVDIALSVSDVATADSVTGSTDSVDHKEVGGDCLGYVEVFQTWSASTAAIWEEKDLSGAPYNVPPHAVVEITAYNTATGDYDGGMRATGSSVDRRLKISKTNVAGSWRVLTMHVQADGNSKIEHYAEDTSNIGFALLGYWTCGVYVERFDTFTAGASNSWQDKNLNTYGVGASQVVEMVFANDDNGDNHLAGVRANGSSLARTFNVTRPGSSATNVTVTAMVQADATANATIEVYAQLDSAIDFFVAGYWSLAPGTYVEKLVDVGSPSMSATWEDLDLTGIVSADAVAQFAVGNATNSNANEAGVRKNGSSIARLFDLSNVQGNDTGSTYGCAHVLADSLSKIEIYFETIGDDHEFLLTGYWAIVDLLLSDHPAGQESDAFTKSGGETNAELLAFKLEPLTGTITVTNLVFTITGLKCITDGDWAGLEIVEDTDGDGTISGGETTTVGGTGTVSQSGGTITFAGDFTVTAVTHYIVRADFAELSGAETVTISLTTANITSSSGVDGSATPVTHSDADVAGGLVSHWKFNETSGLTATDSAGTNDGTLISDPTWTTSGKFCGALDFDEPAGQYVNVPADATLNLAGDATITGWFKLDSNFTSSSTTSQIIVEKYDSNDANLVIALVGTDYGNANPSDGSLVFKIENEVGGEGYRYQWTNTTSWTAGTWYHFACTVDSSNAANNNIYIDAVDDTNGTGIGGSGTDVIAMSFSAPVHIGGRKADTTELASFVYFNGVLDDVRLYNRILTAAEIQALAATYTVIDLGTFGGDPSFGFGINAGSIVAGYDENATTDVESAWSWTSCVLTDLGSLGGSSIQANDINDSGDVVGRGDTAGGDIHAFYYDGSLTDLGTLSGRTHSDAIGINNIDDIAGISYNVDARGPRDRLAFLDVPVARYGLSAGMNSLGTLGGVESQALDVNSLGEVVGGAQKSAGDYYPFIWLPSGTAPKYGFGSDGMNSLGTLGGVSTILTHRAHAINANGEIVGQSYTAGGDAHAFLWLPSAAYTLSAGMNDLGVLTGGTASLAFGINDSGQVVGASEVTGGDYHAFIWETGTMTDLNDLLDPNSTWELVRAMDINSEGEISGWGTNLSSVTQGFVLTTCTDTGAGSVTGSPPELESELDEARDPYHEPELIRRAPLPPLCGLGMMQGCLMTLLGCGSTAAENARRRWRVCARTTERRAR